MSGRDENRAHRAGHMPRSVFLSHAGADAVDANKVASFLRSVLSVDVFQKTDLPASEPWSEQLRQKLEGSDAFVVLASPSGLTSEWVLSEVGAAWSLRKPIVALTSKHVPARFPFPTSAVHVVPMERYTDTELWQQAFAAGKD